MRTKLLLFLLICLLIPVTASAHPGRTDANGGHTDHSTGEYHYHHGYEAHQHPDGVCPYDFDDRTGQNSGTPSGSSSSSSSSSSNSGWVMIEEGEFYGFMYNESTDEWMSDDGEYYESSSMLFDCYGFTYDSGCDVWYNEDGFLDEDMCLQDFPDGDLFLCPNCESLMNIWNSEDADYHSGFCSYLENKEEEDVSYYDSQSSQDIESNPSGPSYKDSFVWKAFESLVCIGGLLVGGVLILGTGILTILYGLGFVAAIFGTIIDAIKKLFRHIRRKHK